MAEVRLESVTKIYPGGVTAVRDVSLQVADREFMVLVGPSGCGKTTILRLIAGLEEVTEGRIFVGGREVTCLAPRERDVAMVFQNYALYPHMSVYGNMAFGLKLRGYRRREIRARVEEAARVLGIEHLLDRKPRALSGGQMQRVALGRAIVRQPKVFLFDEPLSNLDAKLRVKMRAELKRLHQRLQATVVYVTHDQVEAMTLGERIAVLNEGRLQQVAAPLEVYERPANRFVAGFIGSPEMNFFAGLLRKGAAPGVVEFETGSLHLRLPARFARALAGASEKPVVLGIRPEAMRVVSGGEDRPAGWPAFPAAVSVVEQLGNGQLVHLTAETGEFIARVESHRRLEGGEAVVAALDPDGLHLFERESGARLDPDAEGSTTSPADAGGSGTAK